MKFCGVVVWYNPADDVLNNINSYITEIEKLYIIDNSKDNHNNLLADYKYQNKCEYISLHKNLGFRVANQPPDEEQGRCKHNANNNY